MIPQSLPDYIADANQQITYLQFHDNFQLFVDERGFIVNKQKTILGSLRDSNKTLNAHKLSIARYITMLITNGDLQ